MKGKQLVSGATNGGNQTDFLVCFPSRARLALMPKPICSPSRPSDQQLKRHHHQLTKQAKQNSTRGRAIPLFKTKNRDTSSEMDEEPTSPKVTCAGQIKVNKQTKPRTSNASSRPSTDSKNWISVVEEIERIRESRKKKPTSWLEAIGIKKDALHIFSSLHGFRFRMGCFGSLPGSIDCTSDEEEDEDEELEIKDEEASSSQDVFSKWFMLIEENNDHELKEDVQDLKEQKEEKEDDFDDKNSSVPPPNALLLMRCRSAPAKGLLSRTEEVETETEEVLNGKIVKEEMKLEEKLVVMSYAPDFFKVSMDIAKETWIVGGDMDFFTRSRSTRR